MYSVLFIIVRFLVVLLVASAIRDASQKPLKFIYKVASANWNVELTRLSKHIRTGGLALSGRGLFYFTRQLILTVKNCSTIVDSGGGNDDKNNNCLACHSLIAALVLSSGKVDEGVAEDAPILPPPRVLQSITICW